MKLPEKLRNLGIQPSPKENEIVKVYLSDHQIHALSDIVIPAEKTKGA